MMVGHAKGGRESRCLVRASGGGNKDGMVFGELRGSNLVVAPWGNPQIG